jgi:hypothetical protein
MMPQIIQIDDFEISDLRLELRQKKQIVHSTWLKRNGNYRNDRRLFKIDNFLLSDILNTNRRTKWKSFKFYSYEHKVVIA